MAAKIYARTANHIGVNDCSGFICQAELWTTTEPESLPVNGEDIIGMSSKDTFAAGSCIICTTAKKVYLMGEDEGNFELWREY